MSDRPSTPDLDGDDTPTFDARTCFCGCGRPVKGLRPKATNVVARRVHLDVAMLSGAVSDGLFPDRSDELAALAQEGGGHLDRLRAYLHGELQRRDRDTDAEKRWVRGAGAHRTAIALELIDRGFVGASARLADLVYAGRRAQGTVTKVVDTGMTVNHQPRLRVTVEVQPADGPGFEVTRAMTVSRVAFPRVGDQVEVAYDAAEPNRFAFRPAPAGAAAPDGDRLAQLTRLAELRDRGLLTAAEVEAEKARILAAR